MDHDNRKAFQRQIFQQILWLMMVASIANIFGNLMTGYPGTANIKWFVVFGIAFIILRYWLNSPAIVTIMYILLTGLILIILPMGWYNSGKINNNALAYVFLFVIGVVILFRGWRRYSLLVLILALFCTFMAIEFFYPDFLPVYDGLLAFWDKLIQVPLTILIASWMMIQYADSFNNKNRELEALSDKYQKLAYTDVLTGLGNRAYIIEELDRLIKDKEDFVVLMIDLDNFKEVNDLYGHLTGDEVLRELAVILVKVFGSESLYGRYGGDEFILLLQMSDQGVQTAMDTFLGQIHSKTKIASYGATVSGGYDRYDGKMSVDSFLSHIDGILYKAKNSGKDMILNGQK